MNSSDQNVPATTRIVFSGEARKRLFEGIDKAARCVAATMGPRGKTVIIQRIDEQPLVTKDGITVSKSIRLEDPIERMGAELVREAAARTNDVAGDGTTTATVLTHAIVREGLKLLEAGFKAEELCKGVSMAHTAIDVLLTTCAKKLTTKDELAQVATISANGDASIGEIIASAMEKVGNDGIITVEDAKGMATTLDVVDGMQVERGYVSPYFVTNNERMHAAYQDALVLITDKKLTNLKDLIPVLEHVMRLGKPLLIVAEDVEGEALQGLVLNRVKSNLPVVAIKAPGYGQHRNELLLDMCKLVGARLVSSATGNGLADAAASLGSAKRVIVDAKTTTIVGLPTTKDAVSAHVDELKKQLEDVTLGVDEVVKLKTRIAKLASGVAVIKVGGATETEMIERKYRIEDALNATRAAAEEGIVPGGGVALWNAVNGISEMRFSDETTGAGAKALAAACIEPLRTIARNAGQSPEVVALEMSKRTSDDFGWNAAKGEIEDLSKAGIIDPTKVTRTALRHAVSVAITFLTLDAVVCEVPASANVSKKNQ